MFDGIIKATVYTKILDHTLVPLINYVYPSSHKFMADDHSKHTSRYAQRYLDEKRSIGGIRTLAELPRRPIPA